jgi:hypothetical protein
MIFLFEIFALFFSLFKYSYSSLKSFRFEDTLAYDIFWEHGESLELMFLMIFGMEKTYCLFASLCDWIPSPKLMLILWVDRLSYSPLLLPGLNESLNILLIFLFNWFD